MTHQSNPEALFLISLLRRCEQRFDEHYHARRPGLTRPQFLLMHAIFAAGLASQRDLCRATGIDRTTVSGMISNLAARGLVACIRPERDQRLVLAQLTASGRRALAKAEAAAVHANRATMASLPFSARPTLIALLKAVSERPDA